MGAELTHEKPPAVISATTCTVRSGRVLVTGGLRCVTVPVWRSRSESPPALVDSPYYAAPVQQDGDTDETGIVGRADMHTLLRAAGQQKILEELSKLRTLTGQLTLCQPSVSDTSSQS